MFVYLIIILGNNNKIVTEIKIHNEIDLMLVKWLRINDLSDKP